jgi:hypothetical protein
MSITRFLVALCASWIINAHADDPLPDGVQLKIEPINHDTRYLLGEPIRLRMTLSGSNTQYVVEVAQNFGWTEQVNVSPQRGVFRYQEVDHPHVLAFEPLTAEGHTWFILVNGTVDIRAPGTYEITVTTSHLWPADRQRVFEGRDRPLNLTSNVLTIRVSKMPAQEEEARLDKASKVLDIPDVDQGAQHTALIDLACLKGDQAARKKVEIFLRDQLDIVAVWYAQAGLALSTNKMLELNLLEKAWTSPTVAPDGNMLNEMLELQRLAAGLPNAGWSEVAEPESARLRSQVARYLKLLEQAFPRKQGAARHQTEEFLRECRKPGGSSEIYCGG